MRADRRGGKVLVDPDSGRCHVTSVAERPQSFHYNGRAWLESGGVNSRVRLRRAVESGSIRSLDDPWRCRIRGCAPASGRDHQKWPPRQPLIRSFFTRFPGETRFGTFTTSLGIKHSGLARPYLTSATNAWQLRLSGRALCWHSSSIIKMRNRNSRGGRFTLAFEHPGRHLRAAATGTFGRGTCVDTRQPPVGAALRQPAACLAWASPPPPADTPAYRPQVVHF